MFLDAEGAERASASGEYNPTPPFPSRSTFFLRLSSIRGFCFRSKRNPKQSQSRTCFGAVVVGQFSSNRYGYAICEAYAKSV